MSKKPDVFDKNNLEDLVRALPYAWTDRQVTLKVDILSGPDQALNALLQHHKVVGSLGLDVRDRNAANASLSQVIDNVMTAFGCATKHMQRAIEASAQSRKSGAQGKGVKRKQGHDWGAICPNYDKRMSEDGAERSKVINDLSQVYGIRPDDLRRGLRQRGRGSPAKKIS
jgi:hypothetical protein